MWWLVGCSSLLEAGELWDFHLGLNASYGRYSDSRIRDGKIGSGGSIRADYLDSFGGTVAYQYHRIHYLQGFDQIEQNDYYVSFYKKFRPDPLSGVISLSLGAFSLANGDPKPGTNRARIFSPTLSYLPFSGEYFVALSYAESIYPEYDEQLFSEALTLQQWTPVVGFAFNQQRQWLQLRGFFISSSDRRRSSQAEATTGGEISLTHYFGRERLFAINYLKVSASFGERMFAVDNDTIAVYNLPDVDRGGGSLVVEWQLTQGVTLLLAGGVEAFLFDAPGNQPDERYTSQFFALGLGWRG
ncbi:MAG: hypothetical protein HQL48_08495 [Gammaproteobacteria bacterium]|nr:hypothetical protein [Gammaproteobacteria bacterium]